MPPLGSRELATYDRTSRVAQDAPPTMRADLLPDEYRLFCPRCGGVTVHAIVCVDGRLQGECEECEPAGAAVDNETQQA